MKIYKIASGPFSFELPLRQEDIIRLQCEKPYTTYDIYFHDMIGGDALVEVNGDNPYIVSINSIPQDKKYTPEANQYKRRGWFKSVVHALQQLGFTQIHVKNQSEDTQRALARMYQNKILSNPENFMGDSMSPHPSLFEIGGEDGPIDKYEKDSYEQWHRNHK